MRLKPVREWSSPTKFAIVFLVGIWIGAAMESRGAPGPQEVAEPSPRISSSASPTSLSPIPIDSPSPVPPTTEPRTNASVVGVTDGDTFDADFKGTVLTIRLIGIDTPELSPPECYGQVAARFVSQVLTDERIRLEFDKERLDRFGRTLAYAWIGKKLLNEWLVQEGYARVTTFHPNTKYLDRFEVAQRLARKNDRGMWAKCLIIQAPGIVGGTGGGGGGNCDASYPGVCIAPSPPDLDCADVPFTNFQVKPPDPHGFDGDYDGVGCET